MNIYEYQKANNDKSTIDADYFLISDKWIAFYKENKRKHEIVLQIKVKKIESIKLIKSDK